MSGPFVRSGGGVTVTLDAAEADVLSGVVADIRAVVSSAQRPDFARRLFPPAYLDDDESQAEYENLLGDDLARAKLGFLEAVEDSLKRGRIKRGRWTVKLAAEESEAWLGVLNDARLTLGTRLDITEDDYESPIDPGSPDARDRAVYLWLGWLEEFLVSSLTPREERPR